MLLVTFLVYGSDLGAEGVNVKGVDNTSSFAAEITDQASEKTISVDQLAAVNAVASVAETTHLPSAGDLRESTASLAIKKDLSQSQSNAQVISKPEIVKIETTSGRGITSYATVQGDSIPSIAQKFKISSQTLRWANNMTSDAVEAGRTLVVPLTNGVVYTVKQGDTAQGLAEKYKTTSEKITLYNDTASNGALVVGSRIVLPDGQLPEGEQPGYVAPRSGYSRSNSYISGGYGTGAGAIFGRSYGFPGPSAGNAYAAGNCTWYSYERRLQLGRPIGGMWGNAYSWASAARAAGFLVNSTPAPGAIFQTSSGGGGYGHVGIVERVEGGRVFVSDMNYAGYNIVTQRELSNPGAYRYIH